MREKINELIELVKETDVLTNSVTIDTPKEERDSIVTRIVTNVSRMSTVMLECGINCGINDVDNIRDIISKIRKITTA